MNLCKEDFIALQSSQVKHTPPPPKITLMKFSLKVKSIYLVNMDFRFIYAFLLE